MTAAAAAVQKEKGKGGGKKKGGEPSEKLSEARRVAAAARCAESFSDCSVVRVDERGIAGKASLSVENFCASQFLMGPYALPATEHDQAWAHVRCTTNASFHSAPFTPDARRKSSPSRREAELRRAIAMAEAPSALILGGCGFVGRNLVQHLVEKKLCRVDCAKDHDEGQQQTKHGATISHKLTLIQPVLEGCQLLSRA